MRVPRLGRAVRAPPPGARQAGRLDLRGRLRGADRRPGRLAARLHHPELGQGLRRPARERLLRRRARLLRRADRRRGRRPALGPLARLPRLGAARRGRRSDRDRLRGRADRVPALRRRRLRRALRPALGDGVSRRDRADHRGGPPDADLRDGLDGARHAAAVEPARPARARRAVRPLPDPGRGGAVPGGVHPPQRGSRSRPDRAPAVQPGHGGRGRRRGAGPRHVPRPATA